MPNQNFSPTFSIVGMKSKLITYQLLPSIFWDCVEDVHSVVVDLRLYFPPISSTPESATSIRTSLLTSSNPSSSHIFETTKTPAAPMTSSVTVINPICSKAQILCPSGQCRSSLSQCRGEPDVSKPIPDLWISISNEDARKTILVNVADTDNFGRAGETTVTKTRWNRCLMCWILKLLTPKADQLDTFTRVSSYPCSQSSKTQPTLGCVPGLL